MKLLLFLMRTLGPVFGRRFFLKLIKKIKRLGNTFYSAFIKEQLGKYGDNFFLMYPIALEGGKYIEIGKNFFTKPGLRLEAIGGYEGEIFTPKITIGDNVMINDDCHIGCINEIIIGNNVLLAARVFITDHFHGNGSTVERFIAPVKRKLSTKGKVVIEDDVWLGEGVVVMPGITVGKGSIVGANSVVTKDVAPYSIVAGTPARLIRSLVNQNG